MAEIASKIRAILDSLTDQDDTQARNVFREIFCNILGFSYSSEKIASEYFRQSMSEVIENAEVIAQTEPPDGSPFFIIYVYAKKMTKTLRQMLIRDLLNFTEAVDLAFANFISIIRVGSLWQIVAPLYRKESDKVILRTYTVGAGEQHRTVAKALSKLKVNKPHPSSLELKDILDEAMYIRPLTEEFFDDYKKYYSLIYDYVLKEYGDIFAQKYSGSLPINIFTLRAAKSFAHSLLNRLMFIYFLQKKGWLGGRKDFVRWLWETYGEDGRQDKEFYKDYLRPLLLEAMNKPKNERDFEALPVEVVNVFLNVPYFNGGLFSHIFEENVDVDEIVISIPDEVLKAVIFEFLEEYNFTVTEESPYEVEIAVDPAMLGHIYESLIAEQERGVSGIFYTPRMEVDLMCRLAIFEYLSNFTDNKVELLEFVFKHPSEFEERVSREILNALENVKIVDPACGSGAFLIGAYYVIRELLEKAGIPVDFERKREIFRKNLYGVDIKEWAVRVAELRMWLALIEEEDKLPGAEPVLPNLNVNLKVGDSLIPEIEVNGKRIVLPKSFLEKWKKYIRGNSYKEIADRIYDGITDRVELERIKTEIVKSVVRELYKDAFITQKTLSGQEVEIGKFSNEEKMLIKILNEAKDVKVPFIWELDFPEVFANDGFDIVISNPPYVRQENIYPEYLDMHEFDLLESKSKEKLKREYKQLVIDSTGDVAKNVLKQNFNFSKRSDLYVHFFVHSVNLLKERGTLVYITSNSWLDVDYGTKLQEFFLRAAELKYIIDNIKRTFEHADINTVITVLKRKGDQDINIAKGCCTNFVMLKVPFESLTLNDVVEITTHYCDTLTRKVTVFGGNVYLYENERVRVRSVRDVDLCVIGGVSKEEAAGIGDSEVKGLKIKNYNGEKWGGLFLRAPPIFYIILKKGEGKLLKLENLAEIRPGCYSGLNDFFYITEETVKSFGIEREFVIPIIRSPEQIKTLIFDPKDLDTLVFVCRLPKSKLKAENKFGALCYIEWGENQVTRKKQKTEAGIPWPEVPSVKNRKPGWWAIPEKDTKPAKLFLLYRINDRFLNPTTTQAISSDRAFHRVFPVNSREELYLASYLNSTLSILITCVIGRYNFGQGLLELATMDAKKLLILDPSKLPPDQKNKMVETFNRMGKRLVLPIFKELGLPEPNDNYSNINPDDINLENIMPDRYELDRIIFGALGLTEEEQLEVYKAVVDLVKQRLVKAQTFKKGRR